MKEAPTQEGPDLFEDAEHRAAMQHARDVLDEVRARAIHTVPLMTKSRTPKRKA